MHGMAQGPAPSYLIRPDEQAGLSPDGRRSAGSFSGRVSLDMTGLKAQALERFAKDRGKPSFVLTFADMASPLGFADHVTGDWIDDAKQIFAAETEGPQVVVGSSMEGWIATHLAMTFQTNRGHGRDCVCAGLHTRTCWTVVYRPRQRKSWRRASGSAPRTDWEGPSYQSAPRGRQKHLVLNGSIPVTCPVRLLQAGMSMSPSSA